MRISEENNGPKRLHQFHIRLVRNVDTSFVEQVLNLPEGERESHIKLFVVWSNGWINIYFDALSRKEPFQDEGLRLQFMGRLNKIPGVSFDENDINRQPGFKLDTIASPDSLHTFLETFSWVVNTIG